MLRSKFKDLIDSYDHVVKIGVRMRLSLPLVLDSSTFPELSSEFTNSVLPALADTHTLIQLNSDIWEGTLPNISLLEFLFNSTSNSSRNNFEKLFHSSLWVHRVNLRILPELIQCVLNLVNKSRDRPKIHLIKFIELLGDLGEVAVDKFSFSSEVLILLTTIVLSFIFGPDFKFISRR
jgi:hypothetical protein